MFSSWLRPHWCRSQWSTTAISWDAFVASTLLGPSCHQHSALGAQPDRMTYLYSASSYEGNTALPFHRLPSPST